MKVCILWYNSIQDKSINRKQKVWGPNKLSSGDHVQTCRVTVQLTRLRRHYRFNLVCTCMCRLRRSDEIQKLLPVPISNTSPDWGYWHSRKFQVVRGRDNHRLKSQLSKAVYIVSDINTKVNWTSMVVPINNFKIVPYHV